MKMSEMCQYPTVRAVECVPSSSESGGGARFILLPFLGFFPGAVAGAFWLPRGILSGYCTTKVH
jgi:hypothetical protein